MDLGAKLLEALDNPASVWDAVLTNLTAEPRMGLLIFTTCSTPVTLVDWQEAVARISSDAAIRFEASLRVLDDNFVTTYKLDDRSRRNESRYEADYRNPFMDDFCADYLDRNVGLAISVSTKEPALHQVKRLVQLGTSYAPMRRGASLPRGRQYPNIYDALIAKPSVLLKRLMDLLPADSHTTSSFAQIAELSFMLIAHARSVADTEMDLVRAHLSPHLRGITFGSMNPFLSRVLSGYSTARVVREILEDDFGDFYRISPKALILLMSSRSW